jgi:hypothetical protein
LFFQKPIVSAPVAVLQMFSATLEYWPVCVMVAVLLTAAHVPPAIVTGNASENAVEAVPGAIGPKLWVVVVVVVPTVKLNTSVIFRAWNPKVAELDFEVSGVDAPLQVAVAVLEFALSPVTSACTWADVRLQL